MANRRKAFNFRSGLQVDNDNFVINSNGLVGIGTSIPSEYLLNVYGDTRITGLTTTNNVYVSGILTATNADVGILSASQIDLGGSGLVSSLIGYAVTDAWIAPDSVGLVTTRKIGIGTDSTPTEQLKVVGNVNITGLTTTGSLFVTEVATASTFSGSGALLNNIPNSATTATNSNVGSAIVSRDSSGNFSADTITATLSGTASLAENLTGSPNITVSSVNAGIVTASTRIYSSLVGVGTNNPNAQIHLRKTGITSIQLTSDGSNESIITFGRNITTNVDNAQLRFGHGNALGSYPYSTNDSLDIINYDTGNVNFYLNPSGLGTAFNWLTNSSLRAMVLTKSGNLGINSTSPTEKLDVVGNITATGRFIGAGGSFGNIQIAISNDNTIDTVSGDLSLNSANNVVVVSGNLDVNGIGTHTFAGDVEVDGEGRFIGDLIAFFSSDERLKDNIEVIEDPLSKVLSISGNTFDWNDNSNKEGRDTGVIAQEVESLGLPGIVTTRDNGYKAVRYEKLVPLLIEAIKELGNKLENLEQKLKVTNSWREFR